MLEVPDSIRPMTLTSHVCVASRSILAHPMSEMMVV